MKKTIRNLSGIYFRVQRNKKWINLCFEELTKKEQINILNGKSDEWIKNLCVMLGNTILKIGDECNLHVE